jgi:hypothetical protein
MIIRDEISVGYAVKELGDMIKREESKLRPFFNIGWLIWLGTRLIFKGMVATVLAALLIIFFGYEVFWAWIIFAVWVLLLAAGLREVVIRFELFSGRVKKGIIIGTSYPRITEQYANVDAKPRRGTNIPSRVGRRGSYYIDYDSEPNPHVLVVGGSSSGKTNTTKAFICRNYLAYGTHFLMIDWDGDQEKWSKKSSSVLWKVPQNLKINMFKLNGMDPEQRASIVEDALLITGRMTMLQATKVKNMVLRHYLAGNEPDLKTIMEDLKKDGRRNNLIIYRLSAIWRVVGEEPGSFWNSIFENNTVISLSGLNDSEKAVVSYFILQRICELFERSEKSTKQKLLVVVDEAWQLLNSSSRLGVRESLAEKIVRVGRRYGFGIITSTQQLGDVPEPFINSSSIIFLHNYRQLQQNRLSLNQFDLAYLASAAQGECLVFDRNRFQKRQAYPDYIKAKELDDSEYVKMKAKASSFEVPSYSATQHNALLELPSPIPKATIQRKSPFKIPSGAPSPAEHAAMLAIFYYPNKTKTGLIQYIKERGWIKSPTTLYGYTAKPGIFDGVVNARFAARNKKSYSLTDEGLKWIDPEQILVNQSDKLGSEEHKRLLISTIHRLHESNILVITSSIKHSPDLIAWPVNEKKKYLWDVGQVKGYEIQTSMRKDSVKQNAIKSEMWGVKMEWILNNPKHKSI